MSAACPLCACAYATVFAEWPDFKVLQCAACGFRFVDTADPSYPPDAQYTRDEAGIGEVRPGLPHIQRRARDVLRFRRPPGRALDVGCGKGELALALCEDGFECTGIDMKTNPIAHLQARYPQVDWQCATLAGLAGHVARFDVLTLYHVLEHIPNPKAALADLMTLANPGALVVIEVPNVGGWEARLKGPRWHYYKADHVSYFRVDDLRRVAAGLGLRVLGIRGYQHFSHPQGVLWKDVVKGTLGLLGFRDVVSIFLEVPS